MKEHPDENRGSDPLFPLPEQEPTRGPVEGAGHTGVPYPHPADMPENLGDPTRRKHPTILSEEGEEQAPATEIGRRAPGGTGEGHA